MLSNKVLHILAETGSPEAQYQLGLHYCFINNPTEAFHWLQQAAAQGHPMALELKQEIIERKLLDEKV